jgi:hypothetical protein
VILDCRQKRLSVSLQPLTWWKLALKDAQQRKKTSVSKELDLKVRDRVMVYMPKEKKGKSRKVARPYFGPYRVLKVTPSNVEVRLVDKPAEPSIFVSLDRVRACYQELGDVSWSGKATRKKNIKVNRNVANRPVDRGTQVQRSSPILSRSQTRQAQSN